jgi:hypothetical protein
MRKTAGAIVMVIKKLKSNGEILEKGKGSNWATTCEQIKAIKVEKSETVKNLDFISRQRKQLTQKKSQVK